MKSLFDFFRAEVDLADPVVARDPFPHYEKLRRKGSVQYLRKHDAWIVLGYDDVQSAFTQPQLFSNRPYAEVDEVLLAADPPEHPPMRRIVTRYFAPDVIERLAAFAERRAGELLQPRMDAVADYANALSEAVAAQLLGLDGDAVLAIRNARAAAPELSAFGRALDAIAGRAVMYGRLLADGVDDPRARSLVRLLWLAATTTTERVIAHCVLRLLQHPETRDAARVATFVDEVLRLHPPELLVPRMTTQPARLGGKEIPANAVVHLGLAAANRDPAKFERPSELLLDRRPLRHFAFGSGIHHCVGATLGRRVVETSVRTLLTRAPQFRAAQPLEDLVGWCSMTASPVGRLLIETAR